MTSFNPRALERICSLDDISLNRPFRFRYGTDQEGILLKTDSGIFAFENRCPHVGHPLHDGLVRDETITCIWHGWRFDIVSGRCTGAEQTRLKKIPILEKDGSVFLNFNPRHQTQHQE